MAASEREGGSPEDRPPRYISASQIDAALSWEALVAALEQGHRLPHARLGDLLLEAGGSAMLSRAAWLADRALGIKSVTVFPENAGREPPLPSVQGVLILFDGRHGGVQAVIDGAALTRWKTVADSLLGARFLGPPAPRRLLVMGAGVIAATLARAYPAVFPTLQSVAIWNRSPARAAALAAELAAEGLDAAPVEAPEAAAGAADIVAAATMAETPVIQGAWLKPGTHVDLIGAYTKTMREADDALIARARLFVDCRETVVDHIGELLLPLAAGVITPADVLGDLYDLVAGRPGRRSPEEITVFKNGGGAHLDLMTAMHIAEVAG